MESRTGIIIGERPCPRHGAGMELVVVECENSSPLHWWCAACAGLWSEEYFIFKAESLLPIRAADEILDIRCPECGGRRLGSRCNPTCCSWHGCLDCRKSFFLRLHETSRGQIPSLELPGTVRLETSPYDARHRNVGIGEKAPVPRFIPLQVSTARRVCEWHDPAEDRHLMTLVHFPDILDERFRFGWQCPRGGHTTYEYLLPVATPTEDRWPHYHWPRDRAFFTRDSQPGLHCLLCGGQEFCNAPEAEQVSCLTCRTVYRLVIEAATGHAADWDQ